MIGPLATVALISAIMFTTWALYVTLVEHPARLESGSGPARAQFQASYRRAAPWQASFALLACVTGVATAYLSGRWPWLVGAAAVGAVVPFTLIAVRPTNQALLGATPLQDTETRLLLERWGRLHTARTLLGAAGVLAFLLALGQP
jgi:anthrone oxygenase-like protein